ncbi:MAG: polysaccharide biosynthesis protein [Clostridia bacterium]|nr:polysaccharide biosynthesis protein [Clostridia bacterium]
MSKENARPKQSFLKGALVLSLAALIVKIIGAVFKIPLANILGGDGMGYYTTAYDMYMPIYVLSNAGLPVAVARVVAECTSKGRFRDARKVLKLSNLIFFCTGLTGMLIMFLGAEWFVNYIKNPGAYLAVMMMAPTVFFVCLTCSFRGYYEGLQNMVPTAISQVVEALVKLILGLGLSMFIYSYGMNDYATTGMVFGKICESVDAAKLVVLQYAAGGAIAGVGLGSLGAALSIYLKHKISGDSITREELDAPQIDTPKRKLAKRIITFAIPIALGSCVSQLTNVIDLFTIMRRLHDAVGINAEAIISMYNGAIPASHALADIPNFLNGSYKGLAVTLYNLLPTFTVAMGVSALPAVTVAWEKNDHESLKTNVEAALRATLILAIPAGLSMALLSEDILMLLFGSRPDEVTIAAPLLFFLGIAVIFSATCSPVNSMLQATGHTYVPLIIMACCSFVKIGLNYVLVGIPEINIRGAAVSTLICYMLIMTVSVICLLRITKIKANYMSIFIKPAIGGVSCALSAYFSCRLFEGILPSENLATIGAIAVGVAVYVIVMVLIRGLEDSDILMLPKGEKLLKIYNKLPSLVKKAKS